MCLVQEPALVEPNQLDKTCLMTLSLYFQVPNSAVMCNIREIQCRVCSFLHQVFIADPNMIKLVHFQVRLIISAEIEVEYC